MKKARDSLMKDLGGGFDDHHDGDRKRNGLCFACILNPDKVNDKTTTTSQES